MHGSEAPVVQAYAADPSGIGEVHGPPRFLLDREQDRIRGPVQTIPRLSKKVPASRALGWRYHDREASLSCGGVPSKRVRQVVALLAEVIGEGEFVVDSAALGDPPDLLVQLRCELERRGGALTYPAPELILGHRVV